MGSVEWSTHAVEMAADHVVKRFSGEDIGRAEREWRALRLLAAHAPGLAPEPWKADLATAGSTVVMSRLDGVPLRGCVLGDEQVRALAEAASGLYAAVPAATLREVPVRPGQQQDLIAHINAWAVSARPKSVGPVALAMDRGLEWLARSGLNADGALDVPPVFGPGDGNLANYLWDGSRVRVVDFEDSGRSDRAFELAEITEHVGSWVEHPLDVPSFLAHFELTASESARLEDCRRLLALVWLFLLNFDNQNARNPPGTAERQADRFMNLLA
ncbi:phosphotransferase family protein [Streptomyces sp. GESEQ-35]|uniref:phosphotransferase family protein n=1 Tax=Streptomyces sp. GESEQ-35 TaxID=2812657 RepID=UPI001B343480|nr:phosphotransferase [Streptomyces sp. GESEQ-35]